MKAESDTRWDKLAIFVLRHAAPGATVKVFCLHPRYGRPRQVAELKKCGGLPFQPPSCTQAVGNVVELPPFIEVPIEAGKFDLGQLTGWN